MQTGNEENEFMAITKWMMITKGGEAHGNDSDDDGVRSLS